MSNVRVNESPNHFMVLDAVARGIKSINKIAKVTKLDKSEVELIVNDLAAQRLIIKSEKKGFFGGKKIEAIITETGNRLLLAKKQELEQKWQQMQQWYNNGNKAQLQQYMDSNRMWMPMMMFSGIMNIMFFASMMSFMGMAMSPAESALTSDAGTGDAQAGADDGGGSSSSSDGDSGDAGSADAGDTGGFDGGDIGGDFSF